jgi:hypothetical protein
LHTSAFAPLASVVPRTAAASSLVNTGACRSVSNGAPAVRSFSLSKSKTEDDKGGGPDVSTRQNKNLPDVHRSSRNITTATFDWQRFSRFALDQSGFDQAGSRRKPPLRSPSNGTKVK